MEREDVYILRLMGEIERDGSRTQRELARRLNVSLGLINAFLKRLVHKGYFKAKTMPRNRVRYLLTPKGLACKSKLTLEYLRDSASFYREIKTVLLQRFGRMEDDRISSILFFGAGEIAELAYLYLQLTDIALAGVVDETDAGRPFFGHTVEGPERLKRSDWDLILLTRLDDAERDLGFLAAQGVSADRVALL